MTSSAVRLTTLAFALVVFFLAWAVIAARPWAASSNDPRLRALAVREARLRQDARLVQRVVARRASVSVTPAVRIVNLPPHTITRTS
jgi:hypothetical protein